MKKLDLKMVTRLAIIAAIYVVATVAFAPLSYGSIQFRLSEVLVLLVLYKKEYSISLIIGCLIANLFSPLGWPDIIFGTLATAISVLLMVLVKNKFIGSLIPAIVNGIIVGIELHILFEIPLFLTMAQVAVGEFVVVTLIGLSVFKAMENNEAFIKIVGSKNISDKESLSINKRKLSASFSVLILFSILYFTFPVISTGLGDQLENFSLFNLSFGNSSVQNNIYLILGLIIPVLICLSIAFAKEMKAIYTNVFLTVLMIALLISVNIVYHEYDFSGTFSIYYIVAVLPVLVELYLYTKIKQEEIK